MKNKRIELTMMVKPLGKARPRIVTKGGRTWAYTPQATTNLKAMIREAIMNENMYFDKDIPLRVEATFYLVKPKSVSKKRLLPVVKPDWDNLGGLLTDSIEKFLFANDSQITNCTIKKRYDTIPRIHLIIEEDKLGKVKEGT